MTEYYPEEQEVTYPPLNDRHPDGSVPAVRAPNPLPTGSRKNLDQSYAYGGSPNLGPAPWLVAAVQKRLEDEANITT